MLKQQRRYGISFACLLTIVSFVMIFGVKVVRVSGQSMLPTLADNQWLLIQRYPVWLGRLGLSQLRRGDVITFRVPRTGVASKKVIKRIVAVPGDTVSVKENGLLLNDEMVEASHSASGSNPYADTFPEILLDDGEVVALEGFAVNALPEYLAASLRMLEPIPEALLKQSYAESVSYAASLRLEPGYYFVLGDNRAFRASEDSRVFGPVPARAITGRYAPLRKQRRHAAAPNADILNQGRSP